MVNRKVENKGVQSLGAKQVASPNVVANRLQKRPWRVQVCIKP